MPNRPYRFSDRPIRLGFVPLTDAAPLVVAQERGLFARHGLRVELRREVGWATLRDKIVYRELDAAPAPAGLVFATRLGLDCAAADVLSALVLNLHGNAITLSRTLWDEGVRDGPTLREVVCKRRGERRATFGVVFNHSSHHVFLRTWLRAAGITPDRDVRIVVVPPAQMFRNLAAGTIDGFCAGEPWGTVAVDAGAGWCPAYSAAAMPTHVEKVLMVHGEFATRRPEEHAALIAALVEACAWCDEPHNRAEAAALLARPEYLNLPVHVIHPALAGQFADGTGAVHEVPHFHVFHRYDANRPTLQRAGAVLDSLVQAGLFPAEHAGAAPAREAFREDLYVAAMQGLTPAAGAGV